MTKHAAYSSEDVVAAVAAPAPAGRHFTSFQALKGAPLDCKKHAAVDLSASGAAVVGGGPWFESMKASSPRRAADAEHGDWMEKHPSALAQFEPLLAAAKGKQIVMFLDYDGTLSPIVEDPDRAVMSEEVLNFVKLTELYYAGSHGMDIQGPAACRQPNHVQQAEAAAVHYQAASEFLPVIEEVFRTLTAKMEAIAGARVEHNKYCLSVHFRCVREEVLEIRPSIKWDKGKALEFLLKSLGYAGRNDVFPIYIGDDRTDEDAFKVLRNMGQGIGILVSKLPKETAASYSLSDPAEVKEFLRKLANKKGARQP